MTLQGATEASTASRTLVILVHGGASSGRSYKDVIAILEQESYRCIAPDLPGHGSVAKQGLFTFESAVETIRSAIVDNQPSDTTHRGPVMLVGISMGGQVVLAFLKSEFASLVDAAIVASSIIRPADEETPWEMPHMPMDQTWLDLMMEDVAAVGMGNMDDLRSKALSFTFDASQISHAIPPVLVVAGEHDMALARRDREPIFDQVKAVNVRCETFVLRDAWHNHNVDVPAAFASVIKDWAKKILHIG